MKSLRDIFRAAVTYFSSSNAVLQTSGTGPSGLLNIPGSTSPAENSVMAFACVIARREAIGSAPLVLSNAANEIIETGALANLLQRPNPLDNFDQYIRKLETHLTLWNMCAVWMGGVREGREPDELVPLHPQGLRAIAGIHQPTGTLRPIRWQYTDPTTGEQREFDAEEILIHIGYNPHAPLSALNPLTVLDRTIKSDLAAREENAALFLNGANPTGYLQTDQKVDRKQMEEILDAWNSANQGFANRHKTAALWGGLKYNKLQLTPMELDYINSLRAMRIDYYMVFRVYPAMLAEMTGETGLSQGSSTDSQRAAWWEDVGIPELDLLAGMHQRIVERWPRLAGGLNRGRALRSDEARTAMRRIRRNAAGGKTFVWFNDAAIPAMARMRYARIQTHQMLTTGIGYRPDEINEYLDLGLPQHPDNDGRVPFALQVTGAAAEPVGATGSRPAGADDGALRALARVEDLCRADVSRASRAGRVTRERERFQAFIAPREKALARKYSRFFLEQRGRVMERLGTAMRAETDELKKIFPLDAENTELVARLTPLWSEIVRDGWGYFNAETGTQEQANPFVVDDPGIQAAISARQIQGAKVNETTRDDLRALYSKSFDEGWTNAQLGDAIADYYKANIGESAARPMTAARTQVAGIVNDGRLAAAKNVGGLKKGWLHGSPDEPRPAHVSAQERYLSAPIPLDAKFEINGYMCDGPGDAGLPVGEVANCTCMLTFEKGS